MRNDGCGPRHGGGRFLPVFATLCLLAGGCQSAPEPVPEGVVVAEEQRLMRSYQSGMTVVADSISFEISPNFDERLARPATNRFGGAQRTVTEEGDTVVYRWVTSGGLQEPLKFRVLLGDVAGQLMPEGMDFAALQSAELRVRGSGGMVFDCVAQGQVTVAGASAQGDRNGQELSIRDGQLRMR